MAHSLHVPLLIASITASTLLSGFLLTFSSVAIPGVLAIPHLSERPLLSVWKQLYYRGFRLSPPLAVFSGLCCYVNAYLTSAHRKSFPSTRLSGGDNTVPRLLLAGSLMIGIVPYTGLVVAPGNRRMMARWRELVDEEGKAVGEERKGGGAESRERVRRWGVLNYGRVVLPLAGAMVACSTAW